MSLHAKVDPGAGVALGLVRPTLDLVQRCVIRVGVEAEVLPATNDLARPDRDDRLLATVQRAWK